MQELSRARMSGLNGGGVDPADFACGVAVVGQIALATQPMAFWFFIGKTFALCAFAAAT